jgi:hypothetical protein
VHAHGAVPWGLRVVSDYRYLARCQLLVILCILQDLLAATMGENESALCFYGAKVWRTINDRHRVGLRENGAAREYSEYS